MSHHRSNSNVFKISSTINELTQFMLSFNTIIQYLNFRNLNFAERMIVGAVPNEEKMTKRAGKLVDEFKELVFPVGYTPGVKRKVGLPDHRRGLPSV